MKSAYSLNDAAPAGSSPDSRIWGREAQLEQLESCWDTARRGRPLVIRLLGDPGVGKSALINAFRRRIDPDVPMIVVSAAPEWAHTSYRFLDGLADAWGAEATEFGPDANAVWHLLGRSTPSEVVSSPKAAWFIAFRALVRWLAQRLDRGPCILVLEDLHWVDPGSLEFLEYWFNELGTASNRAFLLVLSERTGGGFHLRANGLGNILMPLPPLLPEESLLLAADRQGYDVNSLPEALLPDTLAVIDVAQGNPFLLTALLERRSVLGEIPDSVRSSVQARIRDLNPAAQALLALSAVAGYHLDQSLMEALCGGNARSVLELVNSGFLQLHGGAFRWSHALLQQAVYEAMESSERQHRHARVAALMQGGAARFPAGKASEAARHLLGAGRTLEARQMLREAADYALQRHDLREGRELLARALEHFEPSEPDFAPVSIRLAEVELARANGPEAKRLLLALNGIEVPGWALAMTRVHERLGDYEAARALLNEILSGTRPQSDRPALELALAQLDLRQGNYLACEKKAAALLDQGLSKSELGLAYSLIGVSCYRLGRYDDALRYHLRALAEREACHDLPGVASSYNNLGNLYYDQGKWPEALQVYLQGKQLAERVGEAWLSSAFDNNLGNLALNQGSWDEAERYYRSALAIKVQLGEQAGIAIARCNLGNAMGRMGRHAEAREILLEAIALMERIGDREVLADLYYHLGMLEVEAHEDERAWDLLQQAIDLGNLLDRVVPVGIAYRGQSMVLMRREEPDRALALIEMSLTLLQGAFASLEHARSLTQAADIAERLGNSGRAAAFRLCAFDAFGKLGAKVDLARLKVSA